MGQQKSKFPVSYEEATHRLSQDEFKRISEAFDRLASNTGLLPQVTFQKDVLTDAIPSKLSDEIFFAFQGTTRGIGFKELLCGIVLLAKGEPLEKRKFVFYAIAGDQQQVGRKAVEDFVVMCGDDVNDVECVAAIADLFPHDQNEKVNEKDFLEWLSKNVNFSSFTAWLLGEQRETSLQLTDESTSKTYHETIATLAGLHLPDVLDLERKYWSLKTGTRFDLDLWTQVVSPALPKGLCERVFNTFDENGDGHIDFPEMVQGVATCCRKSLETRRKFCFHVFDSDKDDVLSWEEFVECVKYQLMIEEENAPAHDGDTSEVDPSEVALRAEAYAVDAMASLQLYKGSKVTWEHFLKWCESNVVLSSHILGTLNQICHVRFGLPPTTPQEEAKFISSYMNKACKKKMNVGDVVYLISLPWWEQWQAAVQYKDCYTILPKAIPEDVQCSSSGKGHKRSKTKRSKAHRGGTSDTNSDTKEMHTISSKSASPDAGSVTNSATEMGMEVTDEMEATALTVDGKSNLSVTRGVCKVDARKDVPQIDNTPLCDTLKGERKLISLTNEGGRLRPGVLRGVDYELVPEEVWKALCFWYRGRYAPDEPALPRYVTKAESGQGLELELYPVHFLMFKHTQYPPQAPKNAMQVAWGSLCTALGVGDSGGKSAGKDAPGAISQPTPPSRVPYYRASFSRNATMKEICGILEILLRVKSDELRLHDFRNEDDPQLLDFDLELKTVAELNFRNGDHLLIETCNRDNTWPEELIKALKEAKLKGSENDEEDTVKERPKKEDKEAVVRVPPGVTGLSNLGNTCFMNSAVQCVSNTAILTTYFRSKKYHEHINKDNPLGMKGDIAKRYGDLVSELWKGTSKSIVPLRFRLTIARYSPQFAGFQQQDAQELLSFLLDGLHEDLNRVQTKAYRELQDSDGRPDEVVANEAWSYHLERNQSIVVDLFHGQLKSSLRCLECGFLSVKFDPFTFLSLPLPMESTVEVDVTFVPMNGSGSTRFLFKVDPESKYSKLKEELSALARVPENQILFADYLGGIVRDFPSITSKVKSMLAGFLFAFEIPPPPALKPVCRSDSIDNIERRKRLNTLTQMKKKATGESSTNHSVASGSVEGGNTIPTVSRSDSLEHIARRERLNTLTKRTEDSPEQPIPDISRSDSLEHIARRERLSTLSKQDSQTKKTASTEDCSGKNIEEGEGQREGEGQKEGEGQREEEGPVVKSKSQEGSSSVDSPREQTDSDSHFDALTPSHVTPSFHAQMSNNIFDHFVVAMHRKVMTLDGPYFLAISKQRLSVFGSPVIVACEGCTNRDLYRDVWKQVERLISKDTKFNQKFEVQDDYPFKLKMVDKYGLRCARCSRYQFCNGCTLECCEDVFSNPCSYLAIDWDPTVLHLRYQYTLERARDHESVQRSKFEQSEPIDVKECLKAFTKEEELGDEDYWYCKECKAHKRAAKKLEIWRLPPILIVHVKRFQFHHSRWIKSQRVVTFPTESFNPVSFRPSTDQRGPPTSSTAQGDGPVPSRLNDAEPEKMPTQTEPTSEFVNVELHPAGQSGQDSREIITSSGEKLSENPSDTPVASEERIQTGGEAPVEQTGNDLIQEVGTSTVGTNGDVSCDQPLAARPALIRMQSYAKEVATDERPPTYNLYGVTTHYGMLGGGHYVAFAKNTNGKWYHYNDSACRETTEERVTKEPPYLLFYQRDDFDFDSVLESLGGPSLVRDGSPQGAEGSSGGGQKWCKVM